MQANGLYNDKFKVPRGGGDVPTFQGAPNLLLLLLGGSLRLLAGLAVQVLAAKAGLTTQLGNNGSDQPLSRHAQPGPGGHQPQAQESSPALREPPTSKTGAQTSLLPS